MSQIEEIRVVWDHETVPLGLRADRIVQRFIPPPPMDEQRVRKTIDAIVSGRSDKTCPAITDYLLDGDTVAVPVSGRPAEVLLLLNPLVVSLGDAGVEPSRIRIVCDPADLTTYRDHLPQGPEVVAHDQDSVEGSGYLANTQKGSRVYLNRTILDSDVTLPVLIAEPRGEGASRGYLAGFWPRFSRSETVSKLNAEFPENARKVRREINEVPWLAGVHGAIVAIPGSNGLAEIRMLPPSELQKRVYGRIKSLWGMHADDSADCALIMADDPEGLSEIRLRNVLDLASKLAMNHEKVVLSLRFDAATLATIERAAESRGASKSAILSRLARLGQKTNVAFLGNLPDEVADDCDIVLLEEPGDLERLVNRSGRWLVVPDAWGVRLRDD